MRNLHGRRRHHRPCPQHRGGGQDGVTLSLVADHLAIGPGQRRWDEQEHEDLDQVGPRVGVLERVRGVRVVEPTAVGAQLLDRLLEATGPPVIDWVPPVSVVTSTGLAKF